MTAGPDITSLADPRAKRNDELDQRQAVLRPGLVLVRRSDGGHRQVWAWPGAKQTPGPLAAHARMVAALEAALVPRRFSAWAVMWRVRRFLPHCFARSP